MFSPPDLPFEVLRAPNGDRIIIMRALLTARLDAAQCAELCRQLYDGPREEIHLPVG